MTFGDYIETYSSCCSLRIDLNVLKSDSAIGGMGDRLVFSALQKELLSLHPLQSVPR